MTEQAIVDRLVVRLILPQVYEIVRELMACKGDVPKELAVKVKRLVPQSK
jgi:hypothetical protein